MPKLKSPLAVAEVDALTALFSFDVLSDEDGLCYAIFETQAELLAAQQQLALIRFGPLSSNQINADQTA